MSRRLMRYTGMKKNSTLRRNDAVNRTHRVIQRSRKTKLIRDTGIKKNSTLRRVDHTQTHSCLETAPGARDRQTTASNCQPRWRTGCACGVSKRGQATARQEEQQLPTES